MNYVSSFMSIPQFSNMNEVNTPTANFSGQLVASSLPKLLIFSQTDKGNVCLYEVTELIILLVVPSGMELNIPDVKKSDKLYKTPHGDKSGYVFYKNNSKHVETIDNLFNDRNWRNELSKPLPDPVAPKDPYLLCERYILFKGNNIQFGLFEYSEKSLAFFVSQDITEGNERLGKFWRGLAHPSGKKDGYLVYKNNVQMINFLKSIIPDVPFETMYTKSQALTNINKIDKQRDPQFLDTKQFMHDNITFFVDFFEYSEVSIAIFPTPMIAIPGLQLSTNLINPKVGKSDGYIVAKSNKPVMDMLKNFFRFDNIESLYTMVQETPRSSQVITQNSQINAPSNVINSFDDIPIDTLVRILSTKLSSSSEFTSKELLGNKILIYGNNDKVNENLEIYSEAHIEFTCNIDNKILHVLRL